MPDEVREKRQQYTRPIELTRLQLALGAVEKQLKIFVAGPYIKHQDGGEDRSPQPPAALLRIAILEEIKDRLRHEVILGEHRGLSEVGHQQLRSRNSALVTEMALAELADALVILPSSPGSFSELGSWATRDDFCKKMLILADFKFKDEISYINLGVFPTAQHYGAKLVWIDYHNHTIATQIVTDYVSTIQDDVLTKRLLRGR